MKVNRVADDEDEGISNDKGIANGAEAEAEADDAAEVDANRALAENGNA